jgi:hypothetical protein
MTRSANLRDPILGSFILGPDMQRAVVTTANYDAARWINEASGKTMTCCAAYDAKFGLRETSKMSDDCFGKTFEPTLLAQSPVRPSSGLHNASVLSADALSRVGTFR